MNRFEERYGEWIIRHRWWTIIVTLLVVAVASSGVRYLTLNRDLRVFFSKENPQLQALNALENTYNRIDNVLFVLAPKDGNVFTRKTLAAVEGLTEASWQIPYSSRVDSITNFQHTRAADDELVVEDLVRNADGLSDRDIRRIENIALTEPSLVNRLVSPSGKVTGVNITVLMPRASVDEVPEVASFARKMAADFRKSHPEIDLYLTGAVMFDNAFAEATMSDIKTLVPLMLCAIIIIIGLTLRSLAGTCVTLVIIILSTATGLGLAGWLGITLNPASGNAPTIILVLAVADSVHILAMTFQLMRRGRSKHEAIAESLRLNLQPVFLTSATTAIGFLSMNFSDAPPFRDLGNIVALGVTAAFFYSITFLPALLAVLPLRMKPRSEQQNIQRKSCDRLAGFVIHRRTPVFLGSLLLTVVLSAGIMNIDLNDDWIKYFDKRFAVRRAADFAQENLRGFDIIEYSLNSGESGGINSPKYLKKVEAFADWYQTQPNVVHITKITDIYKRLNKNMHGDDERYYRIPDRRDLAAQYLLLYEMSLPFGLDLNSQINVDKSASRMIVSFKDMSARKIRDMDERARSWLKDNAPEMFTYGSGLSIIWAHISQRNIQSMLGAAVIALVLISLLLIFAFRSLKLGIISLIPNLSPALMGFGLWGMLYGTVGLGLSVVAAMTLGIVVDDTIHFISKYIRARREHGTDPQEAVRYAFNTVGTAMWITTVALVGGFLVLTYSGYRMNSDMGLLTAITITLALGMDFFLLPTLLMKVDGADRGQRPGIRKKQ